MIHQCYFDEASRRKCFTDNPLYSPLDLAPLPHPHLREYRGMIEQWKNPTDTEDWIGFTSYRQLEKSSKIFTDLGEIQAALVWYDVIGFGYHQFHHSLADQAELYQPGFNQLLLGLGVAPPPAWYQEKSSCLYCNYFIMKRDTFDEYMNWSYPKIQAVQDQFVASHLAERMLIIWSLTRRVCRA